MAGRWTAPVVKYQPPVIRSSHCNAHSVHCITSNIYNVCAILGASLGIKYFMYHNTLLDMCVCVCVFPCTHASYTFYLVRVEQSVLPWQLTSELSLVCAAALAGVGAATHTCTHTVPRQLAGLLRNT